MFEKTLKLLIEMKNGEVLEFVTDITSINRLKLRYGIRNENSVIEIAGQLIILGGKHGR